MKNLVIMSDTPEEDKLAAFEIVRQCEEEPLLKKITWYSNISTLVSVLENRFNKMEEMLKLREKDFERAIRSASKASDRVSSIESDIRHLQTKIEEIDTCLKNDKKDYNIKN